MALKRWDVINRFIDTKSLYLEVGVDEGECFRRIQTRWKIGVDVAPNPGVTTFTCTSDEFFAAWNHRVKFDVIFIDGKHLEEFVDRDVLNAVSCLEDDGVIILHDCLPIDMKYAKDQHTGRDENGGRYAWHDWWSNSTAPMPSRIQ